MAVLTPVAKMQFLDATGAPLVGGLLYTYAAGTTTPQASYTDSTGAQANTNPIVLDARGEANIWLASATYKFKLASSDNTELWTVDNISAPTSSLSPVLSGNVTIDSDSAGPALKITQTGTGPVLRVQDSVDPDVTPFIIDSTGQVGINTQAPSTALDVNDGSIQLSSSGTTRTLISADASNSTIASPGARGFIISTGGTPRITVASGGGVTFSGAVTASGGATITGNVAVTGTLSSTSTLTVSSGGAAITGNSTVTGTLTSTSTLTAQNGLTVSAGGAGITGLLTANSGVSVPSGGVSVTGTVTATTFTGAWTNLPAGTVMLFVQTAAPTGWTKSTAHDNKALRVVSGSASSGGSVAFTTAFASQAVSGTNASYVLTTADIPSHTHTATQPPHSHYIQPSGFNGGSSGVFNEPINYTSATTISTSSVAPAITVDNTGGGGGHTHSFTGTAINLAVQYVDVIIATKD